MQHIHQHNGECECSTCEHAGEICETGNGYCRVFPALDEAPSLRTHETTYEPWKKGS